MRVEARFRGRMDPEARRRAAGAISRVTGIPFEPEEDRAHSPVPLPAPTEEGLRELPPLGTRFLCVHDTIGAPRHRLVLFFPAASGQLRKRLRSAGIRESLAPLFAAEPALEAGEGSLEWIYRQEEGDVAIVALYSPGAAADALGDRVLGLSEALAKVDKKSLERWVGKYVSGPGPSLGEG